MDAVDAGWVSQGRWLRVASKSEVDAPPAAVWAVLSDPDRWSEWHKSFEAFETPGDRLMVGAPASATEWRFHHKLEINEYAPERAIGFTMLDSTVGFAMKNYGERISIEPGATTDTCTIEHAGRIAPSVIGWALATYWLGFTLWSMSSDFKASTKRLGELASRS